MVASWQMTRSRSPRITGLLLLAGSLFLQPPRDARSAAGIAATPQAPSSISAHYGAPVAVRPEPTGGSYLVPTSAGIEFRWSDPSGDRLFGVFRTAGTVNEVVWSGSAAYLLAGERGIVAVDVDTTGLVAIGSHDNLGDLRHGAFAPSSGTLAVAADHDLFFLHEQSPGNLSLLESRSFTDGRRILRIQAHADSFLVLSLRFAPTLRMMLTMYRVPSGATTADSLWEFAANGFTAQDLVWPDGMAFVAAGNSGVVPFNTVTRVALAAVPVSGTAFVRSVAADAASVVAVAQGRVYAHFVRSGPGGGTLGSELDQLTSLDPFHVTLENGFALTAEDELVTPVDPDEIGTSVIEVLDTNQPGQPGRITTTGLGRVHRVRVRGGLAYVADYTGGFRIYRAAPGDTSLVGVLPVTGNTRVYDLALDPSRPLVYLAAGTAGVLLVDVSDSTAPFVASTVTLPGITVAVGAVDTSLVAAGRRGGSAAGVSFLNVSNPALPTTRGALDFPSIVDPRAFAVRDTILFVADAFQGLTSISFRDPDVPARVGLPSAQAASDLDLQGTRLLVGTTDAGLQVADVTIPGLPVLVATLPTPPIYGVTQQGQTGIVLLGDGGALAVDLRTPGVPLTHGTIAVPGFSRDAAWTGDTLLVAESFGLERYLASPTVTADPTLSLSVDEASILPRVRIVWFVSLPTGAIGWNLFRDVGSAQSQSNALGVRVNDTLLGPTTQAAQDVGVLAGTTYRYRLEAFFPDGSSRMAAEGSIYVNSNSALGRVYPNPYRPRAGRALVIPYRVLSADAGRSIEVRVLDLQGRLVRHIVTAAGPAGGFGSIAWDGRDERGRLLADGVYFIHLEGPGIDDARQIILLR